MVENSMCNDITTDNFDFESKTYSPKKYKSKIDIGSLVVYNEQHFNKLQKIMWKLLLGIEIVDIDIEV